MPLKFIDILLFSKYLLYIVHVDYMVVIQFGHLANFMSLLKSTNRIFSAVHQIFDLPVIPHNTVFVAAFVIYVNVVGDIFVFCVV